MVLVKDFYLLHFCHSLLPFYIGVSRRAQKGRCTVLCAAAFSANKTIYNALRLRSTERDKRFFHERGHKGNRQFCQLASSPSQSPTVTALPKGEPLAVHANFISLPRPLPLGEVASRSDDGEGEDADLVLRFLRKTKHRSIRRRSGVPESNYFFAYSSPICWAYSSSSSRSRKGVLTPSRSR